jgi:hypothetical protein
MLLNVTAVLFLKTACCQLHNTITAYSNSEFILRHSIITLDGWIKIEI